ncbi:MAG TPA: hypothetical protein VEX60_05875 [Pyrinomonadaceae bacterium]|nr:hypothetical protein [Pyrinomonadaceae bacterium]
MKRSTKGEDSPTHDSSTVAERLSELGYVDLFHRLDEDALDGVWNAPGATEALEALASDSAAAELPRFLAAEILFHKREDYPPKETSGVLSPVYAAALAGNFTGMANDWGLPGRLDGSAGQNFVALGASAVPHLIGLLDDETRMVYAGSKEATMGNSYEYRVKDAAAFFISRILGVPFQVHESPRARDEEIEALKASLK